MNYTQDEKNLINLDSFKQLSYKVKYMLTDGFTHSPQFGKIGQELIKTDDNGVYNKIENEFSDSERIERILSGYAERGIVCITYASENYPESLKNIPSPPMVLYAMGSVELLKMRKFAVVGSRRSFSYALERCRDICEQLSSHFAVITGIADGADTAAIKGALPSGNVISVVAHGFDYCYPTSNKHLMAEVAQKGLVLSEFLPDTPSRSYYFHVRNRVIAGLAEGVLVVSAAKKSGALITAGYAMEYGKELFAFPYNINVTNGEGCNSLIKQGAKLTENILDISEVFGLDLKKKDDCQLSEDEFCVLAIIRKCETPHISQIASEANIAQFALMGILTSLEIKGLISKLGGNRYSAV